MAQTLDEGRQGGDVASTADEAGKAARGASAGEGVGDSLTGSADAEDARSGRTEGPADDGACGAHAAARSLRFQQLALPHLDAAYNLARWLCGNPSDAEDVVQEACVRAFRFFDTFHGDSARPWLLTIVRRTWYTEWRRRANAHEVAPFDDNDGNDGEIALDGWSVGGLDPEALLIREEDARRVHEALEQLPPEFREVLVLREMEDLSYREIAVIADLPVGTVMSRLARARRKLAALLGGAPGRPPQAKQEPQTGGLAGRPPRPGGDAARRARPDNSASEAFDGM
ncbi:RNA polymerase sigma factor [Paraburkholderia kururiensis]|uniref:RNA polymerase sigma factor n=1 Tax=Paraburkholderia kururiensis TaxID=984307 RepID=A0ABZ0WS70_9BURK|nr:RNA polymerase sigma factor [Paraburkholderia kururiensis]WQD80243.1 RNA polymerase sigma factor [Paraburkholderia kururiensis]